MIWAATSLLGCAPEAKHEPTAVAVAAHVDQRALDFDGAGPVLVANDEPRPMRDKPLEPEPPVQVAQATLPPEVQQVQVNADRIHVEQKRAAKMATEIEKLKRELKKRRLEQIRPICLRKGWDRTPPAALRGSEADLKLYQEWRALEREFAPRTKDDG